MPSHCPACGKEVPPGARACPYCPESFPDDDEGSYGPVKRYSSTPGERNAVLFVLVLAAAGFGMWHGGQWFLEFAGGEDKMGKNIIAPARRDIENAGAPRQARSAKPLPLPDDDEPVDAVSMAPSRSERREETKEWRLRGTVYDLVTLEPLSRCSLVFSDAAANSRHDTMTDGQGRYRILVPPLERGGYTVAVVKEGYARSYLNPGTEGVREMPVSERRSLAADLGRSLDGLYTVEGVDTGPLVTDFYLAPAR